MTDHREEKLDWGLLGRELVQQSYGASLSVLRAVVPFLARGSMAMRLAHGVQTVPRLLAAALCGDVPKLRRTHAVAEASLLCREAVVMLSYCRDLHGRFVNGALCSELIERYRMIDAELGRVLGAAASGGEVAP